MNDKNGRRGGRPKTSGWAWWALGATGAAALLAACGEGKVHDSHGLEVEGSPSPGDGESSGALRRDEDVPGDWTCEAFFPGNGASYGTGVSRRVAEADAMGDCNDNFTEPNQNCMHRQCIDFARPPSAPGAEPRFPPYDAKGRGSTGGTMGWRCKVIARPVDLPRGKTYSALAQDRETAHSMTYARCLGDRSYCEWDDVSCLPVLPD